MNKQEVYELLRRIPKGKVATYGQIAQILGNRHYARAIGNILHANPDPLTYPCYKVVSSKGALAKRFGDGGMAVQRKRLQAEGIEVIDDKVDLDRYQWRI